MWFRDNREEIEGNLKSMQNMMLQKDKYMFIQYKKDKYNLKCYVPNNAQRI